MYHLYRQSSAADRYKLVIINPTSVTDTSWTALQRLTTITSQHLYPNLQSFLNAWPFAIFITETSDPTTLPQTHPELFL